MKEYLLKFTGADWASIVKTLIYFAMFCIAFFSLKDAIKNLISRIKNFAGASFASPEQAEQKVGETDNNAEKFDNVVLENYRKGVESDLHQLKDGDEEKIKFLIVELAVTRMVLNFEKIYSIIYGGQILFLKELNIFRAGKPKGEFEHYYVAIRSTNMEVFENMSFPEYMKFLLDAGLLTEQGVNYIITPVGIEFVNWLVREGKLENKSP